MTGFAVCNVYVSLRKIEKKFHLADKKFGKKSHLSRRQKEWSKIYPAVGSEEVALADVLATASYSLQDRCDVLVRDFQLEEPPCPAF